MSENTGNLKKYISKHNINYLLHPVKGNDKVFDFTGLIYLKVVQIGFKAIINNAILSEAFIHYK